MWWKVRNGKLNGCMVLDDVKGVCVVASGKLKLYWLHVLDDVDDLHVYLNGRWYM